MRKVCSSIRSTLFQLLLLLSFITLTTSYETKLEDFVECPFEYHSSGQINVKKYDQLVSECTFATLPFQYTDNNSSTEEISIFIKRFRKRNENFPKKIVWFIPGGGFGPGFSSANQDLEMFKYFTSELYNRTQDSYSIYSIEHRGVGRSGRLSCHSSQAESPASDGGYLITKKEWPKCVKDLSHFKTEYYSSDNAAKDLFNVMKTLIKQYSSDSGGSGGGSHYLYGYYYGAHLIMKMLKYSEIQTADQSNTVLNSIKGVMIENPLTSKLFNFARDDVDSIQRDAFKNLLKHCSDKTIANQYDKTCLEKFGGQDLYTLLKSVMKKVYNVEFDDSNSGVHSSVLSGGGSSDSGGGGGGDHGETPVPNTPCGLISSKLPFSNLTRIFGSLMRTRNGQAIIPSIIYRLNRCDEEKDIHILYNLVKYYASYIENKLSGSSNYLLDSDSVFYNIVFSEFWNENDDHSHNSGETISESEISKSMAHSYVNSGFNLKMAQVWNVTNHWEGLLHTTDTSSIIDGSTFSNPTNIPILVLYGDADPYITKQIATNFESSLSGTNHKLITIPFSLPPTIINSPTVKNKFDCAGQILTSLISLYPSNDVQQVNIQCLDQLQFNFTGSPSFNKIVLHVSDVYEGVYVYSTIFTGTISVTLFFSVVLGISIGFIVVLAIVICVISTMRLTFLNGNRYYKKLTSSTTTGGHHDDL